MGTSLLLLLSAFLCFAIFYKAIEWFEKSVIMLTILFIISLMVFAYMLYVLIRPEKF